MYARVALKGTCVGLPAGNNDINRITKQGLYQLKIDLTTNTAKKKHVVYDRFYVSSERLGYKLKVGGFHGDIGMLFHTSFFALLLLYVFIYVKLAFFKK